MPVDYISSSSYMKLLVVVLLAGVVLGTAAAGNSSQACRYAQTEPALPIGDASYWLEVQQKLADEVRRADAQQGLEILFVGDSIMEHWRGTVYGVERQELEQYVPQYQQTFGNASNFTSGVLAIAGDHTANAWWRVTQVVVLLIGTNDVPAFDCGTEDALLEAVPQILLVVSGLLGAVGAARHVILVGLLPRDTSFWVPEEQWVYPNRYTAAIHQINQGFADIAAADATRYTYLDCGREFTNSTGLRRDMYVEGLHPSSAGNQVLLDCMLQGVKKHVVSLLAKLLPHGHGLLWFALQRCFWAFRGQDVAVTQNLPVVLRLRASQQLPYSASAAAAWMAAVVGVHGGPHSGGSWLGK